MSLLSAVPVIAPRERWEPPPAALMDDTDRALHAADSIRHSLGLPQIVLRSHVQLADARGGLRWVLSRHYAWLLLLAWADRWLRAWFFVRWFAVTFTEPEPPPAWTASAAVAAPGSWPPSAVLNLPAHPSNGPNTRRRRKTAHGSVAMT